MPKLIIAIPKSRECHHGIVGYFDPKSAAKLHGPSRLGVIEQWKPALKSFDRMHGSGFVPRSGHVTMTLKQ